MTKSIQMLIAESKLDKFMNDASVRDYDKESLTNSINCQGYQKQHLNPEHKDLVALWQTYYELWLEAAVENASLHGPSPYFFNDGTRSQAEMERFVRRNQRAIALMHTRQAYDKMLLSIRDMSMARSEMQKTEFLDIV
jgi:hypothetical protein